MNGHVIAIHTTDTALAARLQDAITASGCDVLRTDDSDTTVDLLVSEIADLVIIDERCCPPRVADAAAVTGAPVIALFDDAGANPFVRLVCDRELDHAMPITANPAAVARAAGRALGAASGAGSYLGDGAELVVTTVTSAGDRDTVVANLVEFLTSRGVRPRKARAVATVADELITNAVYNAPRDPSLQPRYAHVSRTDKIILAEHEHVEVVYGFDGADVVVSVTDRFGSLSRTDLRRCLRRCSADGDQIEQKSGGAGIGLYSALMACNQLAFDLAPGARTRVVAVASAGRRQFGRALHIYGSAPANDAIPAPVELSDSMKVELRAHLVGDRHHAGGRVPKRAPTHTPCRRASSHADHSPLDFTLDAVRSAHRADRAVEACADYLARCYRGVVVYRADRDALRPWFANGSSARWLDPTGLDLDADECHLTDTRAGTAVVIPVAGADGVEFIMCALDPADGRHIDSGALARLHRALATAVVREHTPNPGW